MVKGNTVPGGLAAFDGPGFSRDATRDFFSHSQTRNIAPGCRMDTASGCAGVDDSPYRRQWFGAPAVQPVLPCAEVVWNDVTDTPDTLRQCDMPPFTSSGDPSGTARAFLAAHHTALGLSGGLEELKPVAVKHGLNSSHVTFQQTIDTLPVFDAYVTFHLDRDGAIQVVHYRLLPRLRVDATRASVTAVEAVQQARQAINFAAPRASSAAPELMVLPESSTAGRVVWRVMVPAAEPQGDWEVLVDAATGKVVKRYNRLVMDRGQVFDPAPARQPGLLWRWAQTRPALRTEELLGLDGSGWLRGEYVDVTQPEGYRPATAYSPSGDFRYSPDDPRFEEVMVYHYIDATQRYVQSLGYSNANTPPQWDPQPRYPGKVRTGLSRTNPSTASAITRCISATAACRMPKTQMSLSTNTRTRSPMIRFPIGAAVGWRPSAKALATI